MITREKSEIQEVIAHFEDIAPKIAQFTSFGDSNRDKIDLQIDLLKRQVDGPFDVDEDDIQEIMEENGHDYDYDDELARAGRDALEWLKEELDESDGPFKSSWDSLIGVTPSDVGPPPIGYGENVSTDTP